MKVKISSCFGWGGDSEKREFIRLYSLVKEVNLCTLVESYSDADIILVTDIHHKNSYLSILSIPEHRKYYNKILCYSEMDFPPDAIPGIYSSCSKKNNPVNRGAAYYFHMKNMELKFQESDFYLSIDNNRKYLVSYLGRGCNKLRKNILSFSDSFGSCQAIIKDTSQSFPVFQGGKDRISRLGEERKMYLDTLSDSKFVLCPKGAGLSSMRLYESMRFGSVPVIISDDLKLPHGIEWSKMSIILKEKCITDLPSLLCEQERNFPRMSESVKNAFYEYFNEEKYWKYIENSLVDMFAESNNLVRPKIFYLYIKIAVIYITKKLIKIKNNYGR